ncbi:MAG: HAMP domain-containing protein [Clostridium fessum]
MLAVSEGGHNPFGWRLEYRINERIFGERILEQQRAISVVGAIAALILICLRQAFSFPQTITRPIRRMSHTCKEIEENKGSYQKYRFEAVSRHDEIGQLAVTFEGLLKNMDNYTKMEYTSRMAATLAHEIKNPIAGIRSGIQLLKEQGSQGRR